MIGRRCLLTATIAVAVMGGLSSARATDQVSLTIGKLLELTGPLSETGPSQDKAVSIAIDYANQSAAAAGVPLKITAVSADAQGDPQAALSAARALVAKGASAIVGPSITPESIAVANGLTIQKKVTLWPTGTAMRLRTIKDEGTIFRTVPPDSLQAYALAAAVADKIGDPKDKLLSIAYRNEPYGEGLAKGLVAAWTDKGGKVQGPVVFDPAQATFDSEAEQVVDNNPDAYVVIDYPDTFAKFGASLVRTGKYDATKLVVPDALALSTVPSNIPPQALEGARGTRGGSDMSTEAYKLFDQLWTKAGGVEHFALDANSFELNDAGRSRRRRRAFGRRGRHRRQDPRRHQIRRAEVWPDQARRGAEGGLERRADRLRRGRRRVRIRRQRRSDDQPLRHLRI